jgi:hypothetical protein
MLVLLTPLGPFFNDGGFRNVGISLGDHLEQRQPTFGPIRPALWRGVSTS